MSILEFMLIDLFYLITTSSITDSNTEALIRYSNSLDSIKYSKWTTFIKGITNSAYFKYTNPDASYYNNNLQYSCNDEHLLNYVIPRANVHRDLYVRTAFYNNIMYNGALIFMNRFFFNLKFLTINHLFIIFFYYTI